MVRFIIITAFCVIAASAYHERSGSSGHNKFRIIGGNPVKIYVAPYQISLQLIGSHRCGGSIIDTLHVLTAAHCVERLMATYLTVRAGSVTKGFEGRVYGISKIHIHPLYITKGTDNDLAILDLKTPIPISITARPIPIAKRYPRAGNLVLVTGWGKTSENGTTPDKLLGVYVPVIAPELCRRRFLAFNQNMMCAGLIEGGKDSCLGDSGGPAMLNGKLVGVTAWGVGCGRARTPGVYMAVSRFLPFIKKHSFARVQ